MASEQLSVDINNNHTLLESLIYASSLQETIEQNENERASKFTDKTRD